MNVLLEAQKIIAADALSLREGYMLYGEFNAPPDALAEIQHLETVAALLGAAAAALGVDE